MSNINGRIFSENFLNPRNLVTPIANYTALQD